MAGTGAAAVGAHDATVVVENNVGALEAALVAARQKQEEDLPAMRVAGIEARIAKMKEHIAHLEADLAAAKADLKAGN
jgi:uncharacterized small protein (DUF1192 family)